MSRKNIIYIVIIAVVLVVALIIYLSSRGPSTPETVVIPPSSTSPTSVVTVDPTAQIPGIASTAPVTVSSSKILPLGKRFDLTLLKQYNADGKLFNYPKVQPEEVGPTLSEIIKKVQ